eukprot:g36762.t1
MNGGSLGKGEVQGDLGAMVERSLKVGMHVQQVVRKAGLHSDKMRVSERMSEDLIERYKILMGLDRVDAGRMFLMLGKSRTRGHTSYVPKETTSGLVPSSLLADILITDPSTIGDKSCTGTREQETNPIGWHLSKAPEMGHPEAIDVAVIGILYADR